MREVKILALKLRASSTGEIDLSDLVIELNEFLNDGPNSEQAKRYLKRMQAKKIEQSIEFKTAEDVEAMRRLHFPELYQN